MAISESVFSTSFRTNWIIMIIFLGLDLSSKIWIRLNVPLYETTELLANILDLTHVQNRGVSFSFWQTFLILFEFLSWLECHCWLLQQCCIIKHATGANLIFSHGQD